MSEVLRDSNGKWIVPPKSPTPITHANAREMQAKRWAKYRQAAVERIVGEAKSIDPSVSVGADAYGLVASKQFVALMESDKPRMYDLEKLGQLMTGYNPNETSRRANADIPPGVIAAQPAALVELVAMLEQRSRQAVDAARATDGAIKD